MRRVMLLNPKGGSGKTTIATTLAAFFASSDLRTMMFDHDAQGSTTRWLRVRPAAVAEIEGVAAFRNPAGMTRTFQMRVPPGVDRVVIDTPAGLRIQELADLIRRTDRILIPVLPSPIDIDAVANFAGEVAKLEPVRSGRVEVAVVANRVREKTLVFRELERFLDRLDFPFVATLRESQSYVRAAERGLGLHELHRGHTRVDRNQWAPLVQWLEPDEPAIWPEETAALATAARVPKNYVLPV